MIYIKHHMHSLCSSNLYSHHGLFIPSKIFYKYLLHKILQKTYVYDVPYLYRVTEHHFVNTSEKCSLQYDAMMVLLVCSPHYIIGSTICSCDSRCLDYRLCLPVAIRTTPTE